MRDFLDNDEVFSSNESTGLMPTLPDDEMDNESYNDIYKLPTQRNFFEKTTIGK